MLKFHPNRQIQTLLTELCYNYHSPMKYFFLVGMEMPSQTKKYQYGMGLMEIIIFGNKYYGHSGFWGSHLLHCPTNQETICININQAAPSFDRLNLIKEILAIE